jgi:hypothetical protein
MIRGLGDLKKDEEQKGKTNEYYAGGDKSGIAVQTPEDVRKIMEQAREQSSLSDGPP